MLLRVGNTIVPEVANGKTIRSVKLGVSVQSWLLNVRFKRFRREPHNTRQESYRSRTIAVKQHILHPVVWMQYNKNRLATSPDGFQD